MPFPTFLEEASTAIDAIAVVHKDLYTITPMREADDRNGSPVLDTSRPVLTDIVGMFYDPAAKPLVPNGFDPRTSQRPGTMSGHPKLDFPPSVAATLDIRRHDIVLNQRSGMRHRIATTFTTKAGVRRCEVNLI
jgi:hypothetical protein